jgi:hypothetical protein
MLVFPSKENMFFYVIFRGGKDFTCNAMLALCKETGIDWHFIAPDKPTAP